MNETDEQTVDRRAIGVFDSGVGGLTVLHECLVNLPHEDFVYLGDTANFPYGPEAWDDVRRLAFAAAGRAEPPGREADHRGLQLGRRRGAAPAAGLVLHPHRRRGHARRAGGVQETRERRVGVLATEATVRSNAYQNALQTLDAGLEVFAVACPRLAPLIQDGDVFSEEIEQAAREYVAPLKQAGVDTVILGCTHYPLISPMLRRLLGPAGGPDQLGRRDRAGSGRDPGAQGHRERAVDREGDYRFFASGDPEEFREVGARFLQLPIREVSTSMTSNGRPGTRGPAELRPLKMTPDFVSTADGSVFMELGGTRVLCSAQVVQRRAGLAAGERRRLAHGRVLACCPVPRGSAPRARPCAAGRTAGRSRSSASSGGVCGRSSIWPRSASAPSTSTAT